MNVFLPLQSIFSSISRLLSLCRQRHQDQATAVAGRTGGGVVQRLGLLLSGTRYINPYYYPYSSLYILICNHLTVLLHLNVPLSSILTLILSFIHSLLGRVIRDHLCFHRSFHLLSRRGGCASGRPHDAR